MMASALRQFLLCTTVRTKQYLLAEGAFPCATQGDKGSVLPQPLSLILRGIHNFLIFFPPHTVKTWTEAPALLRITSCWPAQGTAGPRTYQQSTLGTVLWPSSFLVLI